MLVAGRGPGGGGRKLKAPLLDGNHRAIAAIELGDPLIPVYVGENYRDDITPREWIKA